MSVAAEEDDFRYPVEEGDATEESESAQDLSPSGRRD